MASSVWHLITSYVSTRARSDRWSRLGFLGLLAGVCGCSFVFVQQVPEDYVDRRYFNCTESSADPVLDTLFVGVQIVRIGYAASASDEDYKDAPFNRNTDLGLGLTLGALGIASAVYGYTETSKCREAKADRYERNSAPSPSWHRNTPPPAPSSATPPPPATPPPSPDGSPPPQAADAPETDAVPTARPCSIDSDCAAGELCVGTGTKKTCRPPP